MAEPPSPSADQYSEAIAELRSAAKWLIASFGAVGAALIAGVQLSQLSHVHHEHLWEAVGAIIVALAGVALAIYSASNVLIPGAATISLVAKSDEFKQTQEFVESDPSILKHTATGLNQFAENCTTALEAADTAYANLEDAPDDPALQTAYRRAERHRKRLELVEVNLLGLAVFLRIRDRFSQARRKLLIGALLATGGALVFVYYANPPAAPKPKPGASTAPIHHIELTPVGRQLLKKALGPKCHADDLSAVRLPDLNHKVRVLTFPQSGCLGIQVVLDHGVGTLD